MLFIWIIWQYHTLSNPGTDFIRIHAQTTVDVSNFGNPVSDITYVKMWKNTWTVQTRWVVSCIWNRKTASSQIQMLLNLMLGHVSIVSFNKENRFLKCHFNLMTRRWQSSLPKKRRKCNSWSDDHQLGMKSLYMLPINLAPLHIWIRKQPSFKKQKSKKLQCSGLKRVPPNQHKLKVSHRSFKFVEM